MTYGTTSSFVPGGVLDTVKIGDKGNLLLLVYVLCFCGFSVKTAVEGTYFHKGMKQHMAHPSHQSQRRHDHHPKQNIRQFVSKWNLCRAAVDSENPLAYAGVAALMVSALLTAIYMLSRKQS